MTHSNPRRPDLLKSILDELKKIAAPVAGGLIGILVKDPKKLERIKAAREKIGHVAGKVEKALSGVLELSRKILGKAMTLLDNVFGIPRGIVVAVIGAIPFVGGLIASAINFGLGIVVGMIKDFLTNEV